MELLIVPATILAVGLLVIVFAERMRNREVLSVWCLLWTVVPAMAWFGAFMHGSASKSLANLGVEPVLVIVVVYGSRRVMAHWLSSHESRLQAIYAGALASVIGTLIGLFWPSLPE
jgi:hypothetical protein